MSRKAQRKKRRKVSVPVASMGDIAFLLIIFFLGCSDIIKEKDVPMTLPESQHVKKIEDGVAARVSIDNEGKIYLDGLQVDNAKDIETGVRALLTNTVSDSQRFVQFKCDAQQPKQVFQPVLQAIADAGGRHKVVGTMPADK